MTASPESRQAVTATRLVPLDRLKAYPRNPRLGNIEAIAKSLRRHGQYRALVVNRPTMQVLAGNHTLAALRHIGAAKALVHFIEVDENDAARIVLADNRLADIAVYQDDLLGSLLQSLPDLEGTGYDQGAVDALLAGAALPAFEAGEDDQGRLDHLRSVTCPNCQEEFELPA
jgi:ParB-like chromosome segregation protein Spo0J